MEERERKHCTVYSADHPGKLAAFVARPGCFHVFSYCSEYINTRHDTGKCESGDHAVLWSFPPYQLRSFSANFVLWKFSAQYARDFSALHWWGAVAMGVCGEDRPAPRPAFAGVCVGGGLCVCLRVHVCVCASLCVHVCVCTCMRVCMCMCVCVCMCTFVCACVCLCVCVCTCVCMPLCTCMCTCACVSVCAYACPFTCMCMYMCVCAHVGACACLCVHVLVRRCALVFSTQQGLVPCSLQCCPWATLSIRAGAFPSPSPVPKPLEEKYVLVDP